MRVGLDTNVLVYAEGVNGAEKQAAALDLIGRLPPDSVTIPVQALGELFHVLVRKAKRSRGEARDALITWRDAFSLIETSPEAMMGACDLATDHQLGIWDALMLSASARAGCRLLLSEDMQDGFTWSGLTVANPFARAPNALLEDWLG